MPTCPICGGNIASTDQNCPYCGKTQLHLGDGDAQWDLPMEDNTSLVVPEPAPWAPEQPSPGPAAGSGGEDWLLPEAMLETPAAPAPAEVSLPPWVPVAVPAESAAPRQGTTFEFSFDLEEPGPAPTPAPLPVAPIPVPFEPPAWQPSAAPPNYSGVDVSLVPGTPIPNVPVATSVFAVPTSAPSGPATVGRVCIMCGKAYGADYRDSFCECGAELMEGAAAPAPAPPAVKAPVPPPKPMAAPQRPPAGTRCLVLYGADRQPVQYFAITKDAMLVGRLDAASGCFPEIDISEYVDPATARKVSRKHALILRNRATDSFSLRPLPGNTGTQVDTRMLSGPEDVPLPPGSRVILGGAVRFKFEVM